MLTKKLVVAGLAVAGLLVSVALSGCSSTYPRREPVGEQFPSVVGNSLEGDAIRIPEDFAGSPVLLLIGYDQDTQFDLDRWIMGLTESKVDVTIREVPTIPGLVPGMFANKIDAGMRKGIPSDDWGAVVTVYGDGDQIAQFLGNEVSLPGRIVLLDAAGKVVFFHDDGFSVGTLTRLRQTLAGL